MKKILLFGLLLLCITGCSLSFKSSEDKENNESSLSEEERITKKVNETFEKMTIDEKIGQMLMISYRYPNFDQTIQNNLEAVKPGGFILFKENVTTFEKTKAFVDQVKKTADIPMLIGIDQEGGKVQRIKNLEDANVLEIPPMYEVGKTNDEELSYQVGKVVAEELTPFGINLDFAPSVDIFSNPENTVIGNRAFGSDAATVVKMALPFARGLKENHVIPVVKHFPGHGDTMTDSHYDLPVVTKTKEELWQQEILPFQAAIDDGIEMVMVAHIALPNVTGNMIPASLSKEIVTDFLRKELNYQNIVITDAIDMKALSERYSLKEICTMAINAGVDIILMPPESKDALKVIKEALSEGTIQEEQINTSVKRILTLKYKNKLDQKQVFSKENIGTEEHQEIINKLK